jgi:hypothetical protein
MFENIDQLKNKLGRIHLPDPRDHDYLLPRQVAPITLRKKFYPTGRVLDQGNSPQCVAYATTQFLRTGPVFNQVKDLDPTWLYHECQLNDEWTGESYDGTSVRAAMKVLKREGYLSEYRWAFDINTVVQHLLTKGPMVLGTDWYLNMFNLNENGFIVPEGPIVGGHAYLAMGVNLDYVCYDGSLGAIRMVNSWGPSWGTISIWWLGLGFLSKMRQN